MNAIPEKHGFSFHLSRDETRMIRVTANGSPVQIHCHRKPSSGAPTSPFWGADSEEARFLAHSLLRYIFDEDIPSTLKLRSVASTHSGFIEAVARALLIPETRDVFDISDSAVLAAAPPDVTICPPRPFPTWPRPGTKLRFTGAKSKLFPYMTDNANSLLTQGEVFTLRTIQVLSSYNIITLEETGDAEYSIEFFKRLDMPESA